MAHSKVAVYGALGANAAIAVMKFITAGFTGSSAMLSEGIHSLVDTGNQLLLLLGISRSQRPPDKNHPFGHGKEVYFWSLIVSILIFGLGGGMSVYEGIMHVRHPEPLSNPFWNYVVLGLAAAFEGTAFYIALKQLYKGRKKKISFWQTLKGSKDPTLFVVLYEDGAAVTGLLIAFVGIFLSHTLNMPVLDGVASILIGILLAIVAIMLVVESRNLLVGESASSEMVKGVYELVRQDPDVNTLNQPLTMHLAPEEVLLALDVQFRRHISGDEVAGAVRRLEGRIRKEYPSITRIYMEARHLAEKASED